VSDHHPPDPDPISPVAAPPRIVGPEDPRPKPAPTSTVPELPRIAGRAEPPAAEPPPATEPELSFRARVEPHGNGAEVVARARTRIGVIAVSCVLIVFFIVAGVVLVARSGAAQREDPRQPDLGRCTQHIERIERTEWTCTRDGP
jgi:hypothetical protein